MVKTDTIAAIATPLADAGIGIVRISGEEAFDLIGRIFRKKDGSQLTSIRDVVSREVYYGFIYDGDRPLDEVLMIVMKAPHSYTAEDTVEIDCHGGSLMMKRILETVVRNGARLAEPGEFTKRLLEREDRSVPGRGGDRCDQRPERPCAPVLREPAARLRLQDDQRTAGKDLVSGGLYRVRFG